MSLNICNLNGLKVKTFTSGDHSTADCLVNEWLEQSQDRVTEIIKFDTGVTSGMTYNGHIIENPKHWVKILYYERPR